MIGSYVFVLQLPEEGTPVPKHVAVLIIVMNCILLSASACGYSVRIFTVWIIINTCRYSE